jgi:hypothetical protein
MRRLGFAITRQWVFAERRIPPGQHAHLQPAWRRRLDDDIVQVFHRACHLKDQEAAADVLALLEKWRRRRVMRRGLERRGADSLTQQTRR